MKHITWKGSSVSQLVLGTAQLGMSYGIANEGGQPAENTARDIIDCACACGINTFDTAQVYGTSETVLGRSLANRNQFEPQIITKLSPNADPSSTHDIERLAAASCKRLRTEKLWCLMLHNPGWLAHWGSELGTALCSLQQKGTVAHLGVSVYTAAEARTAIANPAIDIIELPCNAWDQRMLKEGIIELAHSKGKLCIARSIFLQGLLILSPERVMRVLPQASAAAEQWCEAARIQNIPPDRLAIGFALALGIPFIVGCETPEQVLSTIELLETGPLSSEARDAIAYHMAPHIHEGIMNPSLWNRPS